MAADDGCVVLDELADGNLIEHVNEMGAYLEEQLSLLQDKYPVIYEVRGS